MSPIKSNKGLKVQDLRLGFTLIIPEDHEAIHYYQSLSFLLTCLLTSHYAIFISISLKVFAKLHGKRFQG